ncbi:MAG: ParA family protein [Planctomycetota bacterium]
MEGDYRDQPGSQAAPVGQSSEHQTFGDGHPNDQGQSFGASDPDERGRTAGRAGPDVRVQTLGPAGPPSGYQENHAETDPVTASHVRRDTQVVAVGNQKGGVCKSTLTVNLAAALGAMGRRCLIIDLDANCGATRSLGVPTSWMGTFEALLGTEHADQLVLRTDPEEDIRLPENVDLLPGNRKLEELDRVFRERRENKFRDPTDALHRSGASSPAPLELLRGHYDYIFLDTAPNAASPTIAAYKSADWFLLSMTPDKLAYEALVDALTDILAVRDSGNPGLQLLGVVLSQIDRRTSLAERYIQHIAQEFSQAGQQGAFETTISRSVVVTKANEAGEAVRVFDPRHRVAQQFDDLAAELERRIGTTTAPVEQRGGGGEPVVELDPQAAPRPTSASERATNA